MTESVALPPNKESDMTSVNLTPRCAFCHKPMKFMLVKGGGRKFQCESCGQPDPLHSDETLGWLKGELGKQGDET